MRTVIKEKTIKDNQNTPSEKKQPFSINLGISDIITGFTLISIGFGIGFWTSSNNQKFDAMDQKLNCNERIEVSRKEWERERKNEETLESLKMLLISSKKEEEIK